MLLLVFLILFAFIFLGLMSKNFYLYSKRKDESTIGRVTLWSAVVYMVLALILFVISFIMLKDSKVQYTVNFQKLVSTEALAQE
uniref:Uncharacterized protein n=1 Tax=Marseillevirus LCMAC202 TaxID=2506606 RepID=A0A481Z091_9VIRU|nr:MAG: hypothetical protein LCMAC202_04580 [Marseillevirus LCMAC202]